MPERNLQLSPSQVSSYFSSQGGAVRPLSPLEWQRQQMQSAPVQPTVPPPAPITKGVPTVPTGEEINELLRRELLRATLLSAQKLQPRLESAQTTRDYFTEQRAKPRESVYEGLERLGIQPTLETITGAYAGRKEQFDKPVEMSEKTVTERMQALNVLRETAKSLVEETDVGTQLVAETNDKGDVTITTINKKTGNIIKTVTVPGAGKTKEVKSSDEKEEKMETYGAEQAERIKGYVTDALTYVSPESTGLKAWATRNVPGTAAFQLQKKVNPILASIGFGELQRMRQASPTGGALGSIAVKELDRLEASLGDLDIRQHHVELTKTLNSISEHYQNWIDVMEKSKGGDIQIPQKNSSPVIMKDSAGKKWNVPADKVELFKQNGFTI